MIATSIAISVAYTLLATLLFILGFRAAKKSERALTLYVLVASVLRMLSAAAVLLIVVFIVDDRQWRITFAITFSAFYLLMLIFDVVFFIRSQNSKKTE